MKYGFVVGCFLALALTTQVDAGDCIKDQYGNVVCGKGQCAMDYYGKVLCAKEGGGAVRDRYGVVKCRVGFCAMDDEGRVKCSTQHGVRHAVVAAGGDSRVLGDRCGRPWMVGVRDPRREGEVRALLPLEDAAVSTSGDYERFFDDGDERCHHLIDPRTGKSPHAVRSVTVIAPDGLTSEALSKTVFVLGVEQGLRIVESIADADAVVVDSVGRLHYSAGLLAAARPPLN